MPVVTKDGSSVKVVMGSTDDVANAIKTPEPVTLLDVQLNAGKTSDYQLRAGWNATVYLLSGCITLSTSAASFTLNSHEAIALGSVETEEKITFTAGAHTRFLLVSGPPVEGH